MKFRRCVEFLLLILFFLLISFSCLTRSSPDPVLDTHGFEVQSNTKYYILPLDRGNGGGLELSSKDRPCPLIVIQENYEASDGLPLKLLLLENKQQQVVNLSTDLNVVFWADTICVQSTVWKLGGVDEITGRRYVSIGGIMGVQTVDISFKIEKYGNGYKIVWCPNPTSVCGNVGVFVENGKRWLGLSDVPLVVVFKRSLN